MKGFSSNCIIIAPKIESCENRTTSYWSTLRDSCLALQDFLRECEIQSMAFVTDEVARQIAADDTLWLNPCTPEDTFFVQRNCEGMSNLGNSRNLDRYYPSARNAFKVKRGMSIEDRFAVIVKREKQVAKTLIAESRLVATFCTPSNSYYKVASVKGDKRLILRINPINFLVECEMSGAPVPANYIITERPVSKPLYEWRNANV